LTFGSFLTRMDFEFTDYGGIRGLQPPE